MADAGKQVLLVSTDSARNLDEMLGITLANTPVPVPRYANNSPAPAPPKLRRSMNLFDEFASLLSGAGQDYDAVVFDALPTGHTLRLLGLPKAWTGFLADNDRGASCLGPHSGLKMQEQRLAINGVFRASVADDPVATAVPWLAEPPVGLKALGALTARMDGAMTLIAAPALSTR